jgi:hypothetical protein
MRKITLSFLLFMLFLSSCNLPLTQTTDSADVIATRVAGTISAVESTVAVEATQQVNLPTVGVPSETPAPTVTLTVTPTATTSPEDPRLTLGGPDFQFNSTSGGNPFGLTGSPYEDEAIRVSMAAGALNFTSKAVLGGKRWRLTSPQPTDFYLEGTFKVFACSGLDTYGIVSRAPDYTTGQGFYFGVTCNGNFVFDRWNSGGATNLISWTPDTHILTGSNQTNRLGMKVTGENIRLYINGVLVREFTDPGLPAKGHIAAYVSARDNPNFAVDLVELLMWIQ